MHAVASDEIYDITLATSTSYYHTFGIIASEKDLKQKFTDISDDLFTFLTIMTAVFIALIIGVLFMACWVIHLVTKNFVKPLHFLIDAIESIQNEEFLEAIS